MQAAVSDAAARAGSAGDPALADDGRVALIRVQYPVVEELDPIDLDNLKALGADFDAGSVLQVELGGDLFFAFEEPARRDR